MATTQVVCIRAVFRWQTFPAACRCIGRMGWGGLEGKARRGQPGRRLPGRAARTNYVPGRMSTCARPQRAPNGPCATASGANTRRARSGFTPQASPTRPRRGGQLPTSAIHTTIPDPENADCRCRIANFLKKRASTLRVSPRHLAAARRAPNRSTAPRTSKTCHQSENVPNPAPEGHR